MRAVLDASAAIGVAFGRGKADRVAAVIEEADTVLAPDLLVAEVVNTVWKYHQFEHVSVDVCERVIESALGLVDELVSCRELHREAFLLARAARRPVYDMFYLALARREDAVFLTMDRGLAKVAEKQGVRVG